MDTIKQCSKPWCKKTFSSDSQNKTCDSCRQHDRDNQKARRQRKKASEEKKEVVGQKHARNTSPTTEKRPAKYPRTGKLENDDGELSEDSEEFDFEDDDTVSLKTREGKQALMFT
jgi:hypothetical protein